MLFTLKKWLKKVCLFGASASLACFFGSPLANAAPPDENTKGRLSAYVTISAATDGSKYELDLTPTSDLVYNGSDQSLITNAVLKYDNGDPLDYTGTGHKLNLYLRVATYPESTTYDNWTLIDSTAKLASLKGKDARDYFIYYYVDADNDPNLPDSDSDTN